MLPRPDFAGVIPCIPLFHLMQDAYRAKLMRELGRLYRAGYDAGFSDGFGAGDSSGYDQGVDDVESRAEPSED